MYRTFIGLFLAGACVALTGCWEKESKEEPPPVDPLPQVREQLLRTHHEQCVELFVKADGFGVRRMPTLTHNSTGYPKSLELPFAPSTESLAPGQVRSEPQSAWFMDKVELVSLLKNKEPAIYPAEGMRSAFVRPKTRELDEFEQEALKGLQTGDVVKVKESPDHIRMLGAIRLRQDCNKCHKEPEGSLVGAFSYVFKPGVANVQVPVVPNPQPAK